MKHVLLILFIVTLSGDKKDGPKVYNSLSVLGGGNSCLTGEDAEIDENRTGKQNTVNEKGKWIEVIETKFSDDETARKLDDYIPANESLSSAGLMNSRKLILQNYR
jgi:hypothetical protein